MLPIAGKERWITLEPFSTSAEPKTEFRIKQATAQQWARVAATIEQTQDAMAAQGQSRTSSDVADRGVETLLLGLAGFVAEVRNARAVGDALTTHQEIVAYLGELNPSAVEMLKGIVIGANRLDLFEKKGSALPSEPGPSTSG